MKSPVHRSVSRQLFVVVIALGLAACQQRTATDVRVETLAPHVASSNAASSAPALGAHAVTGTATYLERIKMPPGASLRVQLIDNLLADTPKAVIGETTLKDVAGPPYAFRLPFDPAKLRANGQYGLHAALSGPDGKLWFVSDTRVP